MKAARTGGGLLYRSPAAVGDQKDGTVFGSRGRNRRVFVEDLEAVQLHDVLVIRAHIGIELPERDVLETPHGRRWIGIDANRIPRLQHLCSEVQNRPTSRSQPDGLALRTNAAHKGRGPVHTPPSVAIASGTGANVARNRATCWSNR